MEQVEDFVSFYHTKFSFAKRGVAAAGALFGRNAPYGPMFPTISVVAANAAVPAFIGNC